MKKFFNKRNTALAIATLAAAAMVPETASASGATLEGILCNAVSYVTGGPGKALATIAILILGIAAFFGKVTWGLAVLVAVGMAGVFGASYVVSQVSGSSQC